MKKIFALILSAVMISAAAVMLSSCGSDDDAESSPSPSPTASVMPTAGAETDENRDAADGADAGQEVSNAEGTDGEPTDVPSNNEITPEQISIINGTSIEFYDLYLSENTSGNLGENIISGSVFGEGEELVLPYANYDSSTQLNLIAADESGRQYVLENFPISNGAVIEIRLNGSALEAIVQ